jgi:uncharacterized damage-inducible protein DinB
MSPDVAALIANREAVAPFYAAEPTLLARSYAPGKWTLRQVLLHLADAEGVFLDRLKRALADDKPLLWAYDENRWQAHLFPDHRDLGTAGRCFASSREAIIELVTLASPGEQQRLAVHSENGRRSFVQLARMVHEHGAHHLEQIRAIAAGTAWTPRPSTYAGIEPV